METNFPRVITQTAKDYGFKVAAHAHGDEGMYRVVANGVTTIEHGTLIEERTMDLMKAKKTYFVPTISGGSLLLKRLKNRVHIPRL